jgi:hypothetical protein
MGTCHEAILSVGFIIPEQKLTALLNFLRNRKSKSKDVTSTPNKGTPNEGEDSASDDDDDNTSTSDKWDENDGLELHKLLMDITFNSELGEHFEFTVTNLFGHGRGVTELVVSFCGDYGKSSRGYAVSTWGRDEGKPAMDTMPHILTNYLLFSCSRCHGCTGLEQGPCYWRNAENDSLAGKGAEPQGVAD